ncbi:MAG: S46 family peptidase [Acidobacteriota bacterium]|jgi:hypothetical protein|nr:S46 family peptidase [Acidobacteriota bacterium]
MKRTLCILALAGFLAIQAPADEGMWLLNQLPELELEKEGLQISVADIYTPGRPSLARAVVKLGATGEIVSPEGLVLTNHHVAFGAVQRASTKGTDYISSGFLAKTRAEEMEAPGYSARILEKMEDVSRRFAKFKKIADPVKRGKAGKRLIRQITDKIEKGHPDLEAQVVPMFRGEQFMLFVYRRFDDVRVVYIPPKAIGNYGGEIDNWMWPRHTGDFSFLRIYMAPDGSGRAFHKDNVPYKPATWIRVAREGLREGDFTFIMGYPGRTYRYRTSHTVRDNFEYIYPQRIRMYRETIELLESFQDDSVVARMKVAGFIKGLSNAMKNYQGNLDGMKRAGFLEKKQAAEKELEEFLKQDPSLWRQYGNVLPEIGQVYAEMARTRESDDVLSMINRMGGTMTSLAVNAYNTAREREKPRAERDPLFSESDVQRRVKRLGLSLMSFYEPADKALLKRLLVKADQLQGKERIQGLESILKDGEKGIDAFVENAYATTRLKDLEFVRSLFAKSVQQIEALNDPLINLAAAIYPQVDAARIRNQRFNARLEDLERRYILALKSRSDSPLYPDANGTLRFSWGEVAGYAPRDAVRYAPFTTLAGVLEKETGKDPFEVPRELRTLHDRKDFGRWAHPDLKDVPVAFTHKVDSTGGNSGSPVFNAKGELAGILFDGNYEALTGDWKFDADIQRSISVDIRYVLFITEKLAKAGHILKEMGL